jgi:hypothetical protein
MAQLWTPGSAPLDEVVTRITGSLLAVYAKYEQDMLFWLGRQLAAAETPEDARSFEQQILNVSDEAYRARRLADTLMDDATGAALQMIEQAAEAGMATALTQIADRGLPGRDYPTTSPAVYSVLGDLGNALDEAHQRILRVPDDMFREINAIGSAEGILVGRPLRSRHYRIWNQFVSQGIRGFTDVSGRNWNLVSYVEMASRTTVARAYREQQQHTLLENDLNLVAVNTTNDACPVCAEWSGRILSLDGTPAGTYQQWSPLTGENELVQVHATLQDATAAGWSHPNCFPGWVSVASETGIQSADSRWYEGDVVVIHTAAGRKLTVTPNHPILTERGWVLAGALNETDNLVSYHGGVERVVPGQPDHERNETPIREVFETLRQSGEVSTVTVPGTAEQFHGDGVVDSEVNIVFSDRLLGNDGKPFTFKDTPKREFFLRGMGQSTLLATGSPLEILEGSLHASDSLMSRIIQSSSFVIREPRVSQVHVLRHAANVHALGLQSPFNSSPSDSVLLRDPRHGHARDVVFGDLRFDSNFATLKGGCQSELVEPAINEVVAHAEFPRDGRDAMPGFVEGDDLVSRNLSGPPVNEVSGPLEEVSDYFVGDLVSASELRDSLTGLMSFDQVVSIDVREFAGHVYNLETGGGWYTANSIIVHNCQCTTIPHLPGDTPPRRVEYDADEHKARESQRYHEREIRRLKREKLVDPELSSDYEMKIRGHQARIRELVEDYGLNRKREREQINHGHRRR